MRYDVYYGTVYTRIDVWGPDGRYDRTVYVHRSEYRSWDA
jgi:hypothetical protein